MGKLRSLGMRGVIGSLAFWGVVVTTGLLGCTEDDPGPGSDSEGPELRVLFPPNRIDNRWVVSDSTYVYVAARDNNAVDRVDVWFSRPSEAVRRLVGSTTASFPLSQVPDSVSQEFTMPAGFDLYRVKWGTLNINSGTSPQVFATGVDRSGNEARSDIVTVRILNLGQDLLPPNAEFNVRPPSGTVADEFCFDPSPTTDLIDGLDAIRVRWDFDGDGVWDIDWDDNFFANQIVCHRYLTPRIYRARLQAQNSYIEDLSAIKEKNLVVAPEGGSPNPPNPGDFVAIAPGDYPRGAISDPVADLDEYPFHTVRMPFEVQIQRIETTNRLYLDYLQEELDRGPNSTILFQNNRILARRPVAPADSLDLYFDLTLSRIFYNVDTEEFEIEPGFEDHPVTGVSWYGANAYAFRYGLRLPSEAEWEVAARADSVFWRYPYGREITSGDPTGQQRVNYVTSGDPFEGDRGTTPVMYYNGTPNPQGFPTIDSPSARFGVYDLSGNVAEWVNDWYAGYGSQPLQNDPQGPAVGIFKVVRGGSYLSTPSAVRISGRDGDRTPDQAFPSIGFRVAFIDFEGEGN